MEISLAGNRMFRCLGINDKIDTIKIVGKAIKLVWLTYQ